ncbi:MAG: response regulator [Candidatus Aminicenantaceae bacterium]|jgi:CheY-like chemotaxis protein
MVPILVILTVIVFIIVDLALRKTLKAIDRRKTQKKREEALDAGLRLDYTDEALTLKRVEVDDPKAKILAVDDEAIVLDSFRKILVMGGYSIETVEKGQEALGLIQKRDYDFVFVDLKMPDMDGIEVTKAVKHLRPDIDVIVITGYASVESAVETMKYGAMDYVQKPFTEDELLDFVDKSLIRRQDRIDHNIKPQVHLITPSIDAAKSKHKINVPAGIFISPSHTWVSLELNGIVRMGIDDFAQKILGTLEGIELPRAGQKVEKGAPLFSVKKGTHQLSIPSPISGTVVSLNSELLDRIDYIQIKPYELGWICTVEPSNLPEDFQSLIIGADSVTWYQKEIDKYSEKLNQLRGSIQDKESPEEEKQRTEDAAWQSFEQIFLQSKP